MRKKKKSQIPVGIAVVIVIIAVGIVLGGISPTLGFFWVIGNCFGFILQKTRFCFTASLLDPYMTGGTNLTKAVLSAFAITSIGFIAIKDGVAATRVIATIYRDYGNRFDRKQARLKYLIDKMGVDKFRQEFVDRCEFEVHPFRAIPEIKIQDWMGKHEQGDGKFFYGVFVENGRIKDTDDVKLRTAFLKIIKTY